MRSLSLTALIIVATLLAACQSNTSDQDHSDRTTLRVGTDATYPPFEMVNADVGEPEGFDIDLMTEICGVLGWEPEFIVTPFDGIIPGLNTRKYDAVISAMTITPERAAVVAFSEPYYDAGQTIAVPLDDSTIQGPDDLLGKRVGVQLGTTGELMARRLDGLHIYSFDNIGAAFLDMANGNLDAVLNDFPTTRVYINKHGDAKTVGSILSSEHYGIAVRRSDSTLLNLINTALDSLKSSGRYDAIHVKWFGVPADRAPHMESTDTEE